MAAPSIPDTISGMCLTRSEIDYREIDPPLRDLIHRINSQEWISTYGCCAGPAYHEKGADHTYPFYIALFVRDDPGSTERLRFWLDEGNRLNGSTGLRARLESVHQHPLGTGSVQGYSALRVVIHQIRKNPARPAQPAFLRLVRCLEKAWETVPQPHRY
jgi:hypothetical protein